MHRSIRTAAVTAGLAAAAAALVATPALAGGAEVTRVAAHHEYVEAALPDGATARVQTVITSRRTIVTLTVKGFDAHRTYGAHAHVADCQSGPDKMAGGHYQHAGPAVDADNEIWLDVTTDEAGSGSTTAVQDWPIPATGGPESVIIHAAATNPATGKAGPKLACVDAY